MNDIFYQLLDILGAAVGQFPLCQRPNAFIGVELRSVGRKMLNAETRVSGEELLERFTLMSGGVIQEDDDGAAQVPQQRTQKRTDFLLTNILKKKEIVEAQSVPLGADRNAGYHRDFVPPSLAMPMDGSFPLWGPGSDHRGNQEEARFVGEDDVGAQPRSVFFTRGQSFFFQRSILDSFRSKARRSGFWGLQRKLCINRPTWAR
jgi:hypothetical protein